MKPFKLMVYTAWNIDPRVPEEQRKPRLIFIDEVYIIPQIGQHIVIKEGYCAESVAEVIINYTNNTADVTIASADTFREYPTIKRY